MTVIRLQDIKKLNDEDLDLAIQNCFDYAPETSPIDRLAILQEAQIYSRELERRDDSFIAKRDLWLEIIVIGLITLELVLGLYQERDQSKSAAQEQSVLKSMQENSEATTKVLVTLEGTTEKVNEGIQSELELNYAPAVDIEVDKQTDGFILRNTGRTTFYLWGLEGDHDGATFYKTPKAITPGDIARVIFPGFFDAMANIPATYKSGLPIRFFIKNELGVQYVTGAWVNGVHEKDRISMDINGKYVTTSARWGSAQ